MSKDFLKTNKGLFRGNPHASDKNNIRTAHLEAAGTPASDALVIDTSEFSGGESVDGLVLTGKDGIDHTLNFRKQTIPDSQNLNDPLKLPELTASYDTGDLRTRVREAIERHEVDPIVTVEYDHGGNTITITHVGSGTLKKLVVDGAEVGTATRTAL